VCDAQAPARAPKTPTAPKDETALKAKTKRRVA